MLEQDGMTSKNVRLFWTLGDKKKMLDGAVVIERLRISPGLESGQVRMKINSHGLDFMQNIDKGMIELSWSTYDDNPYETDPIFKFLIGKIEEIDVASINDHSADIPVLFEVVAQIQIIWHLFMQETLDS